MQRMHHTIAASAVHLLRQSRIKILDSTLYGQYDPHPNTSTKQGVANMSAITISKSERIDVRVTQPVKQLLQDAARAAHKNVSEFLLDAGILAANQMLADRLRFELDPQQWEAFQAALDQPVTLKPNLKKLIDEPGLLG